MIKAAARRSLALHSAIYLENGEAVLSRQQNHALRLSWRHSSLSLLSAAKNTDPKKCFS
jgi:hypothetical protein